MELRSSERRLGSPIADLHETGRPVGSPKAKGKKISKNDFPFIQTSLKHTDNGIVLEIFFFFNSLKFWSLEKHWEIQTIRWGLGGEGLVRCTYLKPKSPKEMFPFSYSTMFQLRPYMDILVIYFCFQSNLATILLLIYNLYGEEKKRKINTLVRKSWDIPTKLCSKLIKKITKLSLIILIWSL